jgi:hypothetical protein
LSTAQSPTKAIAPKPTKTKSVKPKIVKKKNQTPNVFKNFGAVALISAGILALPSEKEAEAKAAAKAQKDKERSGIRSVFSRGGRKKEIDVEAPKPLVAVKSTAITEQVAAPAKEKVPTVALDLDENEGSIAKKKAQTLEELEHELEVTLEQVKAQRGAEASGHGKGRKRLVGAVLFSGAALRFLWTHRIIITILP